MIPLNIEPPKKNKAQADVNLDGLLSVGGSDITKGDSPLKSDRTFAPDPKVKKVVELIENYSKPKETDLPNSSEGK